MKNGKKSLLAFHGEFAKSTALSSPRDTSESRHWTLLCFVFVWFLSLQVVLIRMLIFVFGPKALKMITKDKGRKGVFSIPEKTRVRASINTLPIILFHDRVISEMKRKHSITVISNGDVSKNMLSNTGPHVFSAEGFYLDTAKRYQKRIECDRIKLTRKNTANAFCRQVPTNHPAHGTYKIIFT